MHSLDPEAQESASSAETVELESVCCVLCGADEARTVLVGRDLRRGIPGEFKVVRCQRCGLAYVNPRPTPKSIGRYYPDNYAPHCQDAESPLEEYYYRLFRRLPVKAGAHVLDVGCGGGRYLRFLRSCGYKVSGVEINAEVAQSVRRSLSCDVYEGDLESARLPSGEFDVVTLWWVLEHTHDPLATLREAHRVLKPGGMIVVGLQNFASISRLLFGANWHHLDLPGHLYHFEPATLKRALRQAGFETIRLRQDLIAKDFASSVGFRLGNEGPVENPIATLLSLPFELAAWAMRRSGLMSAYAIRS